MRRFPILWQLCAVSALLFPLRAFACLDAVDPPDAYVRLTSATSADIIVTGFQIKAAGLTGGTDECALGLGHSGTLLTPTGVTIVDQYDPLDTNFVPTPIAGLAFTANLATTGDLTALVPTTPAWQGFHSPAGTNVAGATPVNVTFSVTFAGGTTYDDIQTELADFGLVASDDATPSGNLAGTNQEIEAMTAIIEVPDCFNGVIDAGEVCDAEANLGCLAGQVCFECSMCIVPGPANSCKSYTLKGVALGNKSSLNCYAANAKLGLPVNPSCLTTEQQILMVVWVKLSFFSVPQCPLFGSYPSSTTVQTTLVDPLGSNLATLLPLGVTTGSWKCASKKFKAANVRAINSLKCYERALKLSIPVNPTCLTKADTKFTNAFTRAESPAFCDPGNMGNAVTVAASVDGFVNSLLAAIP